MADWKLLITTEPDQDGLIVSWKDHAIDHYEFVISIRLGLIAICIIIIYLAVTFNLMKLFFFGVFIALVIPGISPQPWSKTIEVFFYPDQIEFDEVAYPIDSVTRFDYGEYSQLTGKRDDYGSRNGDSLNLVRMWINDKSPIVISRNRWPLETSHAIRKTLDDALFFVRKKTVTEKHEAEYGQVTDDGIPDYD